MQFLASEATPCAGTNTQSIHFAASEESACAETYTQWRDYAASLYIWLKIINIKEILI